MMSKKIKLVFHLFQHIYSNTSFKQNEENESDDEEDEEEEEEDDDADEDETDIGMLDMDNDPGSSSGCTAVVTLLRDKQLLVANAGDSRCVVCRAGRAIEMSFGSYLF